MSRRQARWVELLEQFDFKWEYRPGQVNVADPLSRIPDSPDLQQAKRKSQMAILGITAICRKRKAKQANVGPEADDLAVRIQQAYATEPRLQELRQ